MYVRAFLSIMPLTNSTFRGCLSDESLCNSLRLMVTGNFVPHIERIVNNKKNKIVTMKLLLFASTEPTYT